MNCYRCGGKCRTDVNPPHCVICGRDQHPEEIRRWNERARKVVDKADVAPRDVRTVADLMAEEERAQSRKRAHGKGQGPDLYWRYSQGIRDFNRVNTISARTEPRNRMAEGKREVACISRHFAEVEI